MRGWRHLLIAIGYVGYALVMFVLFVYLTFPSQRVHRLVLASLQRYGLGQMQIATVKPLLPLGLAFSDVSLAHTVNGRLLELLRMPELRIHLRTFLPFVNPPRFGFEGELYGGKVLGTVEWTRHGNHPTFGIHANLRGIQPGYHPTAAILGDGSAEGTLTGDLSLQISGSHWQESEGRLVLQGNAGRIAGLKVMGVGLPPLIYERLGGDVAWQSRSVVVRDFFIGSRDWRLDVQGKVGLAEQLQRSTLDLSLRVWTSATFLQELGAFGSVLKQRRDQRGIAAFSIGGTVDQPRFTL